MYCELFEKDTDEFEAEEQEECDELGQDCNECQELKVLQDYLTDDTN